MEPEVLVMRKNFQGSNSQSENSFSRQEEQNMIERGWKPLAK